jgi:uncharacterized membrane-anchored protein
MSRDETLHAILASIDRSPLPEAETAPLRAAVSALFADRPNAVDKVQAPLGRALRNPLFPDIWDRCVADIPTSPAYVPLRDATTRIAAFVRAYSG